MRLISRHELQADEIKAADSGLAPGVVLTSMPLPKRSAEQSITGLLCSFAGQARAPGPTDHPAVAPYLALFVAFALAMLAAAMVISRHLPLFILEF